MLQIFEMLRKNTPFTGKEIKDAVIKDIEASQESVVKEVMKFYIEYVKGELYFPLCDTEIYKLELDGNNIEAVNMRYKDGGK